MTDTQLAQLKTELDTDPLTLGYAGQPNTQGVADLLNNPALSGTKIANTSVLKDDIMLAVDPDELLNINSKQLQHLYELIRDKGTIDISTGSKIKSYVTSIFTQANAPNTRATLDALKDRDASRGEILFGINIKITHTDVGQARQVI